MTSRVLHPSQHVSYTERITVPSAGNVPSFFAVSGRQPSPSWKDLKINAFPHYQLSSMGASSTDHHDLSVSDLSGPLTFLWSFHWVLQGAFCFALILVLKTCFCKLWVYMKHLSSFQFHRPYFLSTGEKIKEKVPIYRSSVSWELPADWSGANRLSSIPKPGNVKWYLTLILTVTPVRTKVYLWN